MNTGDLLRDGGKNVLITGGTGMVGQALMRLLPNATCLAGRKHCDLRHKYIAEATFDTFDPEVVIHLAGKVGGVKANTNYIGDFYYDNIMINTNVLHTAKEHGTQKVVSFLSTCIFPDSIKYPIHAHQLHDGRPHSSNFGYAHAKRMLDVQSRAYRQQYGSNFVTLVPNNLYGPFDNFHPEDSHVIPAIIRKMEEGKRMGDVTLWGDGKPLRQFTYVDDIARMILWAVLYYDEAEPLCVGNPAEHSIKEVAWHIAKIMGYNPANILWDTTQPEGQYKKTTDFTPFNTMYEQTMEEQFSYTFLRPGLETTCKWFMDNYPNVRGIE